MLLLPKPDPEDPSWLPKPIDAMLDDELDALGS
jgi:hypothetical protein